MTADASSFDGAVMVVPPEGVMDRRRFVDLARRIAEPPDHPALAWLRESAN